MDAHQANACAVAVVGAGPYGLSVAAHLRHAGVSVRLFGEPMSFWRHHMPRGMKLRSPWRATHLSSPDGRLSLDAYAALRPLERDRPLPLEQFIDYGEWFQRQAAADVDRRMVSRLEATGNGFRLRLADGDNFAADRVVIATGLVNQDYRPPPFDELPPTLVTHACEHADLAAFRGRRVAVIGRGQSACESAALLAEAGAEVEIISRGDIRWLGGSTPDGGGRQSPLARLHELTAAPSAVGPFPLSWLAEFPGAVRRLPPALRDQVTQRCLKAGATGWLRPRFKGVSCNPGRRITGARALPDGVVIRFDEGTSRYDHILLGTGYRIDVSRLGFLAPSLLARIACRQGSPLLAAGFQSSVPKLHFVGCYAVGSYGPLMRFIAGAPFAARTVTAAAAAPAAPRAVGRFSKAVARWFAGAADALPQR